MSRRKTIKLTVLWIARIWGTLSLAFILFFVGAHVIGSITGEGEGLGKFQGNELLSFLFFPVSIMIGLGLALKWEGLGGFITIAGIVCFHFIRPDLIFDKYIDGLAAPGFFYILYWILSRKDVKETKYDIKDEKQ